MSPGLREKKQAQTKRAIYEAAMRLFSEKGFAATTVDEIAEAAGVGRATFFNYFGTKDGVLDFYSERLAERLVHVAREGGSIASPLARMRRFVTAWLQFTAEHEEEARQVYLNSFGDPRALLNQSPTRQGLFALFEAMVKEGQERGEVRTDLPGRHLAGLVLSIYQTVVISFLLAGEPLEELLDSAWRFVLHGVEAGRRPQGRPPAGSPTNS